MQNWENKKKCAFGHIDKFLKEHDREIKKNAYINAYLGSIFIPEKYVIRVLFVSPWTSLIPPLAIRVAPGLSSLNFYVHNTVFFLGGWQGGSAPFNIEENFVFDELNMHNFRPLSLVYLFWGGGGTVTVKDTAARAPIKILRELRPQAP